MDTYGPDDAWPAHPRAWWRQALDLARERGWSLTLASGHAWGTIRCPQGCKVLIFSSGRGGESAAKGARRTVERCTHAESSVLARAVVHLDDAQRLTGAAAELLEHQARLTDVEEMLDLATEALTAAEEEELLQQIDALPEPENDQAGVALGDAEDHLGAANAQLTRVPGEVAKPHRKRARQIRSRIDELRAQLAGRPDNIIRMPMNDSGG